MRSFNLASRAVFSADTALSSGVVSQPTDTVPATVVEPTTTDKPKRAKRTAKPTEAKPVSAKLAAKPGKPDAAEAPATPSRDISRTATTIAANRTNFGGSLSDRDNAYITFFASFVSGNKPIAIRAIAESARGPAYNGSAKPYDAGVVNRLRKAGVISVSEAGDTFTFTKTGRSLASFVSGAPKA